MTVRNASVHVFADVSWRVHTRARTPSENCWFKVAHGKGKRDLFSLSVKHGVRKALSCEEAVEERAATS